MSSRESSHPLLDRIPSGRTDLVFDFVAPGETALIDARRLSVTMTLPMRAVLTRRIGVIALLALGIEAAPQ
jgi:hypothetical protein